MFNLNYLKREDFSGLSVQSRRVLHPDCPIGADRERSRFWKDPKRSHKSSLGNEDHGRNDLIIIIIIIII